MSDIHAREGGDPLTPAGDMIRAAEAGREEMTHEDCLDFDPNDQIANPCSGKVEFRMALSPSGRAFPRCDRHWDKRLTAEEENTAKYGHWQSDVPPHGFDPLLAGERWDEDY